MRPDHDGLAQGGTYLDPYDRSSLKIADLECPTMGYGRTMGSDGRQLTTIGSPWLPLFIFFPWLLPDIEPSWYTSCIDKNYEVILGQYGKNGSGIVTRTIALYDPPRPVLPGDNLVDPISTDAPGGVWEDQATNLPQTQETAFNCPLGLRESFPDIPPERGVTNQPSHTTGGDDVPSRSSQVNSPDPVQNADSPEPASNSPAIADQVSASGNSAGNHVDDKHSEKSAEQPSGVTGFFYIGAPTANVGLTNTDGSSSMAGESNINNADNSHAQPVDQKPAIKSPDKPNTAPESSNNGDHVPTFNSETESDNHDAARFSDYVPDEVNDGAQTPAGSTSQNMESLPQNKIDPGTGQLGSQMNDNAQYTHIAPADSAVAGQNTNPANLDVAKDSPPDSGKHTSPDLENVDASQPGDSSAVDSPGNRNPSRPLLEPSDPVAAVQDNQAPSIRPIQVGGSKIIPGEHPVTVSGLPVSLDKAGNLAVGKSNFNVANLKEPQRINVGGANLDITTESKEFKPYADQTDQAIEDPTSKTLISSEDGQSKSQNLVTIAGQAIEANPSGFTIGKRSIHPGSPAITFFAIPISLGTDGMLQIGSRTTQLTTPTQANPNIFTIGTQTLIANPSGFTINSNSILPGKSAVFIDSTSVSLGTDSILHIASSTISLSPVPFSDLPNPAEHNPNIITLPHLTLTANPTGFPIPFFHTSLSPNGAAATISGTPISLGTDGVLVIGSSTTTLLPLPPTVAAARGENAITIEGLVFTPVSAPTASITGSGLRSGGGAAVVVNGTTIFAGAAAVMMDGENISLGTDGNLTVGSETVSVPAVTASVDGKGGKVDATGTATTTTVRKKSGASERALDASIEGGGRLCWILFWAIGWLVL
ncbi:uncharacterized protein KY384_006766 [Bacidia gigantensis]|uniref:uncharacterized protein n=1 Tax=Bacidia gigantensis TaxID=2732470 RepID=UPI001D03C340|nr:uncharacterized protein KY384_006766 [Bacidia gigantensis]KAG8527850.1 hypothetical protein KY384_006766 [Bacidia gigantensis]